MPARETKWRWGIAAGGGVLVGALAVALFRGPPPVSVGHKPGLVVPSVTLRSPADLAVNEESVLLDPTPLFLPTKWNAAQRDVSRREIGDRFQDFDAPRLTFNESDIRLSLPEGIQVPLGPAESVSGTSTSVALGGIGRRQGSTEALSVRGAFVQIVEAKTGRTVVAEAIAEAPPFAGAWQPLELMARLDAAGLVGPLVVMSRSGVDEVDGYFSKYLVRTLRIGERLEAGIYRICVGP